MNTISHRAAGFSLVESLVAGALLVLMALAVATLSQSGSDAHEYARRLTRATETTQSVVDDLRLELVSSVRLFGADAEGAANLAVLELAGAPPPLAGSRLPTLDGTGTIRRDTAGAEITGNSLFFARLAWTDRFVASSGAEYLVDVSRWVYVYLARSGSGPAPGSATGLDLVRVVGEPLADASAIDAIRTAADRRELLLHLVRATPDANGVVRAPCHVVWRRGGMPGDGGTLRQIDPGDGSLRDDPLAGRPDPWRVLRKDAAATPLFGWRHHAVASNFAPPAFGVCRFALPSAAGDGFPHGFETQITGPSSARQVLLKLVVASTNDDGRPAWSNLQVVVDARDL